MFDVLAAVLPEDLRPEHEQFPERTGTGLRRRRGAVLLAAALPLGGIAEEAALLPPATTPPARVEREELIREEEPERFRIYVGVGVVSQYVSRGLVFLDKPSLQPWIELDVPLGSSALLPDGFALEEGLTAFGGTWSNVNLSGSDDGLARTGRAAALRDWYEADVYGGLRMRVAEHLATSLRYNFYTSPSDSFRDIHEIDWRISFDDASFWQGMREEGNVGLYPALRVAKELRDAGGPDNWYFQPSLTPTWYGEGWSVPMTFQVPLILGFGAGGQYLDADGDERHFGFFETGFGLSMSPDVLPEERGFLTFSVGIDHVVLADDDLGLEGEGGETESRAGVSYAF